MKKKLVMLAILLLPILLLTNVNALNKNDMTTLSLKRIKSLTTPSGYSTLQGGTTTDKYIVSLLENKSSEKNAIIVLNKYKYSYAKLEKDNPILNRKYNKGNDVTYNSKTNELIILGDKKAYILDAKTFKEKDSIDLEKKYSGIAYDEKKDGYILVEKTKITIADNNFKEQSSFKIDHDYTPESLAIKGNNIYFACYNKKTGENIIFIYNKEGKKQNIFLIPKSFNGVEYGSLENISFNGNKMILQFNNDKKVNYYTQVSGNNIEDETIKIKLNDKYKDNKYIVNVYENGNQIDTLRNKGNTFTFKPKYTKAGTYKYLLKQKITNKDNVIYDEETKTLTVNVKYNPVTNKYETTYDEVIFNNTEIEVSNKKTNKNEDNREIIIDKNGKKDETKKEEVKEDEKEKLPETSVDDVPQFVEVPDTASSSTITMLIGSIILLINIIIIKRARELD